jgi:hypothetical protein
MGKLARRNLSAYLKQQRSVSLLEVHAPTNGSVTMLANPQRATLDSMVQIATVATSACGYTGFQLEAKMLSEGCNTVSFSVEQSREQAGRGQHEYKYTGQYTPYSSHHALNAARAMGVVLGVVPQASEPQASEPQASEPQASEPQAS